MLDEFFHAREKLAGVVLQPQPEEVADLRARDQHRNAVGEAHHHGARNELHRLAQSGDAHDDQHHARHHGAEEEPVNAVLRENPSDDDNERAGGAADLHL